MRSVYEENVGQASEIARRLMQGDAEICSCSFGLAWKGIFRTKAAEELAARTGQSIRTAGYQLSGEHEPSAQSIAALVIAVTPKRKRG